jgi:hypothetical protein
MSKVEREALADAILGMGKGQESRTFVDLIYRASPHLSRVYVMVRVVVRVECTSRF